MALIAVALPALAGCGDDKSTTTTQAIPVTCAAADGQGANEFNANELVGMTVADAEAKAKANGCSMRVTRRDGEDLPATADYRSDRISVAVTDGEVVEVIGLG